MKKFLLALLQVILFPLGLVIMIVVLAYHAVRGEDPFNADWNDERNRKD